MSYYIFNKATGKARGPVGKKEPCIYNYCGGESNENYRYDKKVYQSHVASLPEIEVHPSLAAIWEDGKRVYENRDFRFKWYNGSASWVGEKFNDDDRLLICPLKSDKEYYEMSSGEPPELSNIVFSSSKEEDQDGLWKDVVDIVESGQFLSTKYKEVIDKLKSKYDITHKAK